MIARVEPLTTTRRLRGPFDYDPGDLELEVGSVVRIPFGAQRLEGVVTGFAETTDVPPGKLATPISAGPNSIPADLVELALWMASEYASTPARALSLVLPPPGRPREVLWASVTGAEAGKLTERQSALLATLPRPAGADLPALRRLEKRGLVEIAPRAQRRGPATLSTPDAVPEPTDEQAQALETIAGGGSWLLHGITGSGKTEVYMRAAAAALERGQGVIVLVPEIALTPQTVARFQARLGDTVALLHSGLSEGERYDEWRRLRTGEARVAVGPRSAVFAPVADLGLIVIDEEHDSSYKHEGDPRYDARAVAARRVDQVLAGSATPRPESWLGLGHLRLTERPGARPLPPVRVLDMRGARHPLHPDTRRALAAARKSIVLLNRRGWSNFVTCRDCGNVWECPLCEVALVLHRAAGWISCHHCGHREPSPSRCGECGSLAVARHGAGTERLEADLQEALDVPIFRLDADTTSLKDAVPELLGGFAAAPAGVLIGTQMVAKGHDFPDVTLGVVVDADSTLRFPDFRAEERTFALIAQLAGRVGRGPQGGGVLVQTASPEAEAIRFAARHDTPGFLEAELRRREALGYPPYADLIRIVCAGEDAAPVQEAATRIAAYLARALTPASQVLGPADLFRLRGRHRRQVVVKTTERARAVAAAGVAAERAAREKSLRSVALSVDVDPQ